MAAAKNTGQTSHWAEPFATSGQQHGHHWAGSHGRGQACHCSDVPRWSAKMAPARWMVEAAR